MLIKDYYNTLQVSPTATTQEIRKAFRRLALQFHPDKNPGSQLAEAQFREIQEAWEVLSDSRQRAEYNYKRWFNRSINQDFTNSPLTPAAMLAESRIIQNYVRSMSIFRVDYDALSLHIRKLITPANISILHEYNDTAANKAIVQILLQSTDPLPSTHLLPITNLLLDLAKQDAGLTHLIHQTIRDRRQRETWDRYKWIVTVVVTGIICWFLYWYGK